MASFRDQIGDKPVYLTFDIDGIDPSYCPGTGDKGIIIGYYHFTIG